MIYLFSDWTKTDDSEETEVARFVESHRGNPMLLDKDGYVFNVNRKRGRKIYWICRETKLHTCRCSAITIGINVAKWKGEHNHEKRPIQLTDYDRKYRDRDRYGNKVKNRKYKEHLDKI